MLFDLILSNNKVHGRKYTDPADAVSHVSNGKLFIFTNWTHYYSIRFQRHLIAFPNYRIMI